MIDLAGTSAKVQNRAMDILAVLRQYDWITAEQIRSQLGLTLGEYRIAYRWLRTVWAPAHDAMLGEYATGDRACPIATRLIENASSTLDLTEAGEDSLVLSAKGLQTRVLNFDAAKVEGAVAQGIMTARFARGLQICRDEVEAQTDKVVARFGR